MYKIDVAYTYVYIHSEYTQSRLPMLKDICQSRNNNVKKINIKYCKTDLLNEKLQPFMGGTKRVCGPSYKIL